MGALFQLIMAFACAGIAIWLYPILKKHNEVLALGAVGFRIIENVFQIVGTLGLLSLLTLSQESVKADAPAASTFQTAGCFAARSTFLGALSVGANRFLSWRFDVLLCILSIKTYSTMAIRLGHCCNHIAFDFNLLSYVPPN